MNTIEKYIDLALSKGLNDAVLISPDQIYHDVRAYLKCAWGCNRSSGTDPYCDSHNTTVSERLEMLNKYTSILLLHSHDAVKLSRVILELERTAFLDGYYFAFALRACNLCSECSVSKGEECPSPRNVRPCETLFGIDIYKTVHSLGLPCEVLRSNEDIQNRYGFLLID
jgi:predicted metal-binding protein